MWIFEWIVRGVDFFVGCISMGMGNWYEITCQW